MDFFGGGQCTLVLRHTHNGPWNLGRAFWGQSISALRLDGHVCSIRDVSQDDSKASN